MALGMTFGGGGDITPYCKFDSRAGRFSRNDRTEVNGQYSNETVDITANFKAVIDMENIEVGYLKFTAGAAPEFILVKFGQPIPPKPADDKFKQGCRFLLKLHASCGGDVRECASSAAAFMRGFDALHTEYEAGKAANPGKLPVVTLVKTEPITSGSGAQKSTNYQPHFAISGWVTRPTDLVYRERGSSVAAATVGNGSGVAPPVTGSTQVGAPGAVAGNGVTPVGPKPVAAGADDFG